MTKETKELWDIFNYQFDKLSTLKFKIEMIEMEIGMDYEYGPEEILRNVKSEIQGYIDYTGYLPETEMNECEKKALEKIIRKLEKKCKH